MVVGLAALVVVPAIAHDANGKEHRHYRDHYSANHYTYTGDHGGVYAYCDGKTISFEGLGRGFPLGDDANATIEMRGDDFVIRNYDEGPRRIRITEDSELIVDGKEIELTSEQRELVRDFYDTAQILRYNAMRIGVEGARIGVKGARLGLNAALAAFKMLVTDYSEEELERDLEREADKLEREAEPIEEMAEEVEEAAEKLEDIYFEMRREIPELRESI